MGARRSFVCTVCALLGVACTDQPTLVSAGAAGGRLDAVYVARGDQVVPVGDGFGGNTSGATGDEPLLNADGQPLGGIPVAVEFLGFEVVSPMDPPDAGTADAGAPDASTVDAGAFDAGPAPDAGPAGDVDGGPRSPAGPLLLAATPKVTLEDWLDAELDVFVTRSGDDDYDVRVEAEDLVPNGLYSMWLLYLDNTATPALYAIAPLGGLPSSFIAEDDGDADVTVRVSRDHFEQGRVIPDAVQVGGSGTVLHLDAQTTIVLRLVFHSSGQTNGNGSLAAPSGPADDVPAGRIGVVGHVGVDVHPHIDSIPMPAIPRRSP